MGVDDMKIPPAKPKILAEAEEKIQKIDYFYHEALTTEEERYRKIVEIWNNATASVERAMGSKPTMREGSPIKSTIPSAMPSSPETSPAAPWNEAPDSSSPREMSADHIKALIPSPSESQRRMRPRSRGSRPSRPL